MARVFILLLALLFAFAPASAIAQGAPPPNVPPQTSAVFAPQQLDQMLAPIALYPDALLAQVLMAATYPLDVVAADRWIQDPANARLRGDALAAALDQYPWDPSVKSLVPFPQVLRMMDSRLDWMQQVGDAFLAQPDDVMASVQRLRQEARAAGTLVSTPQETVEVQGQTILIVPANPEVVYVPVYNPDRAYGAWAYPDYPPVYIAPPPGYAVSGLFFGIGIAIVAPLWGWDDFDWDHRRVRIDPDRFNHINRGRPPVTADVWRHDPARRGAVPYRDARTRAEYQRPPPGPPPAREFRGYAAPQPAARPQTQPQAVRPQAQPQASRSQARPQVQPQATRPQAQPQATRPLAPTQQAARPPVAARPTTPAPRFAPPAAPQGVRPAAPQSAFQPYAGSAARIESQRGAQSRAAPVAAAPRAAPAPRSAAPAQHPAPSGGGPKR